MLPRKYFIGLIHFGSCCHRQDNKLSKSLINYNNTKPVNVQNKYKTNTKKNVCLVGWLLWLVVNDRQCRQLCPVALPLLFLSFRSLRSVPFACQTFCRALFWFCELCVTWSLWRVTSRNVFSLVKKINKLWPLGTEAKLLHVVL